MMAILIAVFLGLCVAFILGATFWYISEDWKD